MFSDLRSKRTTTVSLLFLPITVLQLAKKKIADDIRKGICNGIHVVPDNLPDIIQYVDLLREA